MNYRLIFTKKFVYDLNKLNLDLRKRVVEKLEYFVGEKDPLSFALKLKGRDNIFRFRIGDYRVLFALDKDGELILLVCLKLDHCAKVYK